MGKQTPTTVSFNLPDGREVIIETGKLATQADGSVVVRCGDTMLFCSAVSAHEPRPGTNFFPLSVDYQEKFAAAGRIPGNFFRREARLSEDEILTCRIVDRAIRPFFPEGYQNDTQIIINLISADKETMPNAFAALAASAAIAVSDIPMTEMLSEVQVAKIGDDWVVQPTRSQLKEATVDLIIGATMDNLCMVEGEANECSEQDLIDGIKVAHDAIKTMIKAQQELAALVGDKAIKREVKPADENPELLEYVKSVVTAPIDELARRPTGKKERYAKLDEIKANFKEQLLADKGEEFVEEFGAMASRYYDKVKKATIRSVILDDNIRLDGRAMDEVRPIWCEVDYLPSVHASAIFNRGETQSLVSLTLGTKRDEMMIDNALDFHTRDFFLHYNFPAYSVGEVRPMRGPGRREIGHANLAGRSLLKVMPKDFPYTTRIVSDIMESNGSSSMATVCGGSLALLSGGVPISGPVSGIAMGMVSEAGKNVILTDILGDEDHLGDMDFKVTGTAKGITAVQMDIKIDGLSYDLLNEALEQARKGRLHILAEMNKVIDAPRTDISPTAPRVLEMRIDKSFIGPVIGPGGKVIQEIQKESGATISIEEDETHGVVSIFAPDQASLDAAKQRIDTIAFTPSVGDVYDSVVATVMPYGVFVDFKGTSGLVHISEISTKRIEKIDEVLKVGDKLKVKIIGKDFKTGKLRLSRKALMLEKKDSE